LVHVTLHGGVKRVFAVQCKRRAPYRSELEQLKQLGQSTRHGEPLLIAPRIDPAIARELVDAGWSWADEHGNYYLQAKGLRLSRTGQTRTLAPTTPRLPGGAAGRRLIRWLISAFDETDPISVTALAEIAGVSQAAGSQIIKHLRMQGFVRSPRGLRQVDREGLLHEFVRQYPGAGGHVEHAYSLAPPNDVAQRAAQRYGAAVGISADVGPDMLAPWRVPTVLILYAREPIELEQLELVAAAGSSDANVIIHYPVDVSVFVDYNHPKRSFTSLADPTQMYIDLLRLGGGDRSEAAAKLETWILK
jgi:hypothetical protein